MDVGKILKGRSNRQTRLARPFETCFEAVTQCINAGEAIVDGKTSGEHLPLLERAVVITAVTAIEVYFRDILEFIFKYCSPSFFEPKLKKIHQDKYDIIDLLDVYRHRIHPLELIVNNVSFQSVEKIEKIFSLFLPNGLWGSIFALQVRLKDDPDNIVTWGNSNLEELKRTFLLRHELVHNPGRRQYLDEDVMSDLHGALLMVFGADVVLSKMLAENRDPEVNV